jgi:guanylate kinase
MKGNLIIISSPSGGGKGTLIKEVLRTVPDIAYSISFTTRALRGAEIDGRDYFFVSRAEFENLIDQGEFLEFAEVHGNFYGTSIKQVQNEIERGRDVILEIDVQGAASIRKILPEAVTIFILPPSFEVLQNRLKKRATEKKADLDLRLRNSFAEVERYREFEYVVINDDVARTTKDLQIVILAERRKSNRQTSAIKVILDSFNVSKIIKPGDNT